MKWQDINWYRFRLALLVIAAVTFFSGTGASPVMDTTSDIVSPQTRQAW